jgi:hypothetical protein
MRKEEAAQIVGAPKKTLDDYLLFLRHAKHFNFQFSKHFEHNFGILRKFVKGKRAQAKKDKIKIERRGTKKISFADEFGEVLR